MLIVDDLLPDPLFGAGYPRAFAVVASFLRAGHRVSYYPMSASSADLRRMTAAFGGAVSFHRGQGPRGLRRLLWREAAHLDMLFISRPGPMQAYAKARSSLADDLPRPAVVYDAEAVLAPRERRRRAVFGLPWSIADGERALASEFHIARDADAVSTVSAWDAALARSALSCPVFVLPHPVPATPTVARFGERRDLLFVGRLTGRADASPNVDSLCWFATAVLPLIRAQGHDIRLHVAGLVDAPELEALRGDAVILHGVLPDLRALYDRCRVFVAPTRYAAGIPLKVLEAMGHGIPCVMTPLLAAQIAPEGDASDHAIEAPADPAVFAQECIRLYTDGGAWHRSRLQGLSHVDRYCSPAAFDGTLSRIVEQVTDRQIGGQGRAYQASGKVSAGK